MASKSVLITGCSEGGIGSALAEAFQKRNIHVFATARDASKMSHLEQIPNVQLITLGPTSTSSVEAAVENVRAQTGGTLDYLVNNAGQTIIMPTLDFDVETAKRMYDINVWGMIRVTQAFMPLVITAKGTIVNISSIATCVNTPWMGIYADSKAAVTAITDTLRLELAPFGVKVVTVQTGAVSTKTLHTGKNFKLPPTSIYTSIEKVIAGRVIGEDGTPRMESSMYAEKVVSDALGGANSRIWRGGYASIVRFTSSWFPTSISNSMSIKGTGLDIMKVE